MDFLHDSFDNEFTLRDRWGVEHQYRVEPHEPIRAGALAHKLCTASVKPLITIVLEAIAGGLSAGMGAIEAIESIDLTVLAGVVAEAYATLTPDVQRAVLAHTARDGKLLRDDVAYNEAYRKNWGELNLLVMRVIHINGFVPLDYAFSEVKRLLESKSLDELLSSAAAIAPEKVKEMQTIAEHIEKSAEATT